MQKQAEDIFCAIRDTLAAQGARILQEKIFVDRTAAQDVSSIRAKTYGDISDAVRPSFLVAKEGGCDRLAGVQVHAIVTENKPEVILLDGTPHGRLIRTPACTWLTLSGVSAPQLAEATEQAHAILEKGESALKKFGADFLSVARTWMWLCDILAWYGQFNKVRNRFFTQRGLIGQGTRQSMPASTGIGLCVANGSKCAMDLTAVLEPANAIEFFQALGKQECALEYGSAFSRASRAISPAGRTVFVSGTASIDAEGATTHAGDAQGQIRATIENVRAVLRDTQMSDGNVVQAMAYCKTREIEEIFREFRRSLAWPCVTVICDICRPDLLFEMEITAAKQITSA
jgi:enamine deaminase RidA (YjgF/YER057c/UK114 family)